MTVEFKGEGKYDNQWDAWDDGFTVQAELINDLHAEIKRLQDIIKVDQKELVTTRKVYEG